MEVLEASGAREPAGSRRGRLPPVALTIAVMVALPAPGARIPTAPHEVVHALTSTTAVLLERVGRWHGQGPPPRDVTLLALYQQRLERLLARNDRLSAAVLPRLRRGLRSEVVALRELRRLATPQRRTSFRTRRPAPAAALRRFYREAERRFGVSWNVLAAVNYVESAFGKLASPSAAGAQGPMQFLPATWRTYGLGGDVHDPHDAILGAANYLRAKGAARDLRRALFAYNPSRPYVDAVVRYARRIRRNPRQFLVYYSRQVFVATPSGDRRLTGPRR